MLQRSFLFLSSWTWNSDWNSGIINHKSRWKWEIIFFILGIWENKGNEKNNGRIKKERNKQWEDQKGTKETMGMKEKWEDQKERKKQWG